MALGGRVLIVEDEMLVAADMAATLEDLGYEPAGIAPDTETALALAASGPEVALVDLNLRDGPTGARIGELLSARGISVVFVTANPRMLGGGIPGTLGVMSKPCDGDGLGEVVAYAMSRRRGENPTRPGGFVAF